MQDFQDFKPVIFNARKNKSTEKAGENITKIHDVNGVLKNTTMLDNETEDFRVNRVSSTVRQRILNGRNDKKMTQTQLAQAINEKPQIIQQYESGKAVPTPQILNKLSRVLGVQLNTKI